MLVSSWDRLIGQTPIIELKKMRQKYAFSSHIFAKLEGFNLGGSIKSRAAYYIINDAIERNMINKETVVIEATSGNMGISLSLICSIYDIAFIAIMPENMSQERKQLMELYGAQVILTSAEKGMKGCLEKIDELKKRYPNHFIPSQFSNIASVNAHYEMTAQEILNDIPNIDVVVAGIGTAGTIMGLAKRFKEIKKVKIIGVEPLSSPLISQGKVGKHAITGIGSNNYPSLLDKSLIDEIILVSDKEAFLGVHELAKEGLLVGISSGASFCAALHVAQKEKNSNIVVIFPDFAERYLSILNNGDIN